MLEILDVHDTQDRGQDAFTRTLAAVKQGVDIIIQGRLEVDNWGGYTDILRKVPTPSKWGDWSYEVLDTKLATNTKAGAVLQLCVFTDMLTQIQETELENMYVVKPGPEHTVFWKSAFGIRIMPLLTAGFGMITGSNYKKRI